MIALFIHFHLIEKNSASSTIIRPQIYMLLFYLELVFLTFSKRKRLCFLKSITIWRRVMIKEKVNKENRNERYFCVILLWKIISPFYVVFFTNFDKSSHAWLHMIVYLLSTLVRACYTDKGFELVCGCHNFITTRNEDMILVKLQLCHHFLSTFWN